jgi:hypothetical protein
MKLTHPTLAIFALVSATSCAVEDAGPSDQTATASAAVDGAWSLSADQRRAYLRYYAPLLMKSAAEGDSSHWGYDWLTNFDFDRDGSFQNNKSNWEHVNQFVANASAPQFASWRVRPTMYSAAIEFMEGTNKSLTLLYHVYHAKEQYSIHDWERIEVRINAVSGTPGAGAEQVRYVTVTEHSKHNVRVYPHGDLNFQQTASGRHPMIWQAEWALNSGFHMNELHFVENSWSTVAGKVACGSCSGAVDVNGASDKKDVHYVFVPEDDASAVSYWRASALTQGNASALAARRTSTTTWNNVKRITYELQDLADILATHADCSSCGGVACTTENNWGLYTSHWQAPTVGIWLNTPITSEGSTQLVPASSACNAPVTFVRYSRDTEDTSDGAQGYPHKHWFWGAYRMGSSGDTDYAFNGGVYYDPTTGQPSARPCAGHGAYWCQNDYFAHSGQSGWNSGSTRYEYGRWLPAGWNTPEYGGFDGRWEQLFDDRHY